MSDFSSQGVAACAKAEVESAVSAVAIKKVLVAVMVMLPGSLRCACPFALNKSRTILSRQYDLCSHPSRVPSHFVIPRNRLRDYLAGQVENQSIAQILTG